MKIGIFWYWKDEVLGVAHDFALSDIDSNHGSVSCSSHRIISVHDKNR